jgi:hypothetical protein
MMIKAAKAAAVTAARLAPDQNLLGFDGAGADMPTLAKYACT